MIFKSYKGCEIKRVNVMEEVGYRNRCSHLKTVNSYISDSDSVRHAQDSHLQRGEFIKEKSKILKLAFFLGRDRVFFCNFLQMLELKIEKKVRSYNLFFFLGR